MKPLTSALFHWPVRPWQKCAVNWVPCQFRFTKTSAWYLKIPNLILSWIPAMDECFSMAYIWTFSPFLTTHCLPHVKANSHTKTHHCENSSFPKPLGLLISKTLQMLFSALHQHCNKRTEGFSKCVCMRIPCVYMMQGPEVYLARWGLFSELFHGAPGCVNVCVCVFCVWEEDPSSHTVTCCDPSTQTERTSQPLAHSSPKRRLLLNFSYNNTIFSVWSASRRHIARSCQSSCIDWSTF